MQNVDNEWEHRITTKLIFGSHELFFEIKIQISISDNLTDAIDKYHFKITK
jgi:hypothetical protein